MNTYSLQSLDISAQEFLSAFAAPTEEVCLRIFSDRKGTAFTGTNLTQELKNFSQILEYLQKHNTDNRGIFFVVNHGGHSDSDIKRINAQFVEMDNDTHEEQLARIQAFPLEPSLIVKTRKSLHCYWLMKKAAVAEFRHIQRQLVKQFDGDSACMNESRVLRLPQFYHCKEEPVMVSVIKFNPELRYSQQQLSELLPDIPREPQSNELPKSTAAKGKQKGLVLCGKQCHFLQHCKNKKNAVALSEPLWYAMITNLAVFEGGDEVIHALSKPHPDYDYGKTQAKIEHFHNSGTKPMTCKKIAEHGFKCPNHGKCKCIC